MAVLTVKKAKRFASVITVPGDKSISHRAVMLSGMSNGTCRVSGFLQSEDCLATVGAMRALGVEIEEAEPDEFGGSLLIHGRKGEFVAPSGPIDCGNSGTTMRLLSGLVAGQPFATKLIGDASLSNRPMRRVGGPLEKMGAGFSATGDRETPPLTITGGDLEGMFYTLPVASAQVKSAVLLAGLQASGTTTVVEPIATRSHTERMLEFFQVDVSREEDSIVIEGGQIPESRDFVVPGDISSAAFWIVAAAACPGARLQVKNVGLNETRTGILKVLIRMGARIQETIERDEGERIGQVEIHGAPLVGTEIGGDEIPNVIDELPILAVAGALATGTTLIRDAAELRVKESDRIDCVVKNLKAMGASVSPREDGMEIEGGAPLNGAMLESFGDHRIAMAFAIAGLFAKGKTTIENSECIETSYPGFGEQLDQFSQGGRDRGEVPVISSFKKID
ncbi:MAG: 3-phosphoshikimate 1-carboxyvinyltransferase [Verrucomicrobiota bacterium]